MTGTYGAKYVIKELYSNWNKLNELLVNIASGKKKWLNVAVIMKSDSDAAISEMLNHAVGEAVATATELVLEIAVGQYSLEDICSGPDVDDSRYSTYDKALAAVRQRIEALG
jgi:hypothetical protein